MGLRGPRSVHSCGDWNWERQVSLFQPWARPDGSEQPQGLWVHRAPTEGAGPALTQWARAGGSLGKDSWRIHLVWVSGDTWMDKTEASSPGGAHVQRWW